MKANVRPPAPDAGAKRVPAAPPVYRPQPVRHMLQAKASRVAQLKSPSGRAPAVPPSHGNLAVGVRPPSTRTSIRKFTSTARTVQLADAGAPPPPGPSDADRQAARKKRFAAELDQAEQERQVKQAAVEALKKDVKKVEADIAAGKVRFANGPLAHKHNYRDPVAVFRREFDRAPWKDMQAQHTDRGFSITIRLNDEETVVGCYANGVLTVVHCGEVQGGVGYGVALG